MSSDIPPPEARPYLMQNCIQHYAWGTRGEAAFIPRLLGIEPEPDRPYAELWMGTHPNAPSQVIMDGSPVGLGQLISRYPLETLGKLVHERFAGRLPFLFKVLSAGEALSIQAHPSQEQARVLHAADPDHYPDTNHKPELAIALDSLTALVGFKSGRGFLDTLARYPEIASFIGPEVAGQATGAGAPSPSSESELVRLLFSTLIARSVTDEEELVRCADRLMGRLRTSEHLLEEETLFLILREKYPGPDVGLFAIFFLNLIHLDPGQGMFLSAGIPHAYIQGNIIECMANSDNVVRVGLTPKFKDAQALIQILDYDSGPVATLEGSLDQEEVTYATPVPEFQVTRRRLEDGKKSLEATGNRIEILMVMAGEIIIRWAGQEDTLEPMEASFRQGQSVLIPACLDCFTIRACGLTEVFKAEVPI